MISAASKPKEDEITFSKEKKTIGEDDLVPDENTRTYEEDKQSIPTQIVWKNVVIYIYFHIAALYGIYLCFASAKWATIAWGKLYNFNLFTIGISKFLNFLFSFFSTFVWCFWNYWRRSPLMGPP